MTATAEIRMITIANVTSFGLKIIRIIIPRSSNVSESSQITYRVVVLEPGLVVVAVVDGLVEVVLVDVVCDYPNMDCSRTPTMKT